jgi:hypothetical protein
MLSKVEEDMKAKDAVENLRKLADLLERHGEADIRMVTAHVWLNHKDPYVAMAMDFPKPYRKECQNGDYGDFRLIHGNLDENALIDLRIDRSSICTLVEAAKPAVYDWPSFLKDDEEAQLESEGL